MADDPTRRSVVHALTHGAFATFLVLTLSTVSWRVGPFTWWPLFRAPMLGGYPAELGLLSLLPALVVGGWLVTRLLDDAPRPWRWGRPHITLPLLGLTLLVLTNLDRAPTWRTLAQIGGMGLVWFHYLFVLNERPRLTLPLALVVLIQGAVALGQFWAQSDLGLSALGECTLDPSVSGVSVLWARGQRWLRAYGLTGHPNFLGAMMTVLLLLLVQDLRRMRGWRKIGLTVVISVGLVGLLTSFSRASWLAFGTGLAAWATQWLRAASRRRSEEAKMRFTVSDLPLHLVLPILVAVVFLFIYRDLVLSRFVALDTPIEARSLDDRSTDAALALELIAAHPWRGVGAGNYLAAVRTFEPDSRIVHNVLLLVTAELGIPGAALWLWLAISGLCASPTILPAWLAMLVIGLFDIGLWMSANWRAAVALGLLLGLSMEGEDPLPAR
jgi:O-antigen ligase